MSWINPHPRCTLEYSSYLLGLCVGAKLGVGREHVGHVLGLVQCVVHGGQVSESQNKGSIHALTSSTTQKDVGLSLSHLFF